MSRAVAYVVLIVLSVATMPFLKVGGVSFSIVGGIAAGLAVPLIDLLIANGRYIRLAYYSVRHHQSHIRISASYLFRIQVDGKYLLVRGHRFPQYQPVGGVYKFAPSAQSFLNEIRAVTDDLVPVDETSKDDLRIHIPARHLIKFVRWFEAGSSRESSQWREFYEELVSTRIVPRDTFPYIFADYIRREIRPLRWSEHANSLELLIADIYELLPTREQLGILEDLSRTERDGIFWATRDQIKRRGVNPGSNQTVVIGEHTSWTL